LSSDEISSNLNWSSVFIEGNRVLAGRSFLVFSSLAQQFRADLQKLGYNQWPTKIGDSIRYIQSQYADFNPVYY